jgi:excisionase family DNA binding protein
MYIVYVNYIKGGDEIVENWLTIDEMASKLKVKKTWLYGQTLRKDKGAIPRLKVGKHLRFDSEAVERWIRERNA